MKHILLLAGLAVLLPFHAGAQVVVNPAALEQLAGILPVRPVAVPVVPRVVHHHRRLVVAVVKAKPLVPVVAPVVVAPALPKPVAPVVPVPVPVVVRVAPPKAVSLEFADGSSDLPAGAAAAMKPFCTSQGMIGINARAAADASDPSAAMRLSMMRAFAVRDALVACGVPAQNILPRALGTVAGVDENATVLGSGP